MNQFSLENRFPALHILDAEDGQTVESGCFIKEDMLEPV